MLIGDIISRIRTSSKLVGADVRITDRYIWNQIVTNRDYYLKIEDDKKKLLDSIQIFKPLSNIPLIEVDTSQLCGVPSGCFQFRSKYQLPKMVTAGYGPVIRSVTSGDGSEILVPLTQNSYNRKKNINYSKYDKNIYYYIVNNYIYLPNLPWDDGIVINAYWDDPALIDYLNDCSEPDCTKTVPCLDMQEREYLVPTYLNKLVIQDAEVEIAEFYKRNLEDINVNKNPNQ